MTPGDMKIEPRSQKVNQFKALFMVTISENLKAIGKKLLEISRKQTLAQTRMQTRMDADTYLGHGKPQ